MPSIQALFNVLQTQGQARYGSEAVTQEQHALQCATLAENAQASPRLITACLFHDLGHLVHALGESAIARGINNRHEECALPYLTKLFSEAVTEPIRLHVNAKRYLCTIDEDYWYGLSPVSKRSLELQGGIFSEAESRIFIAQPYAKDAVQLRIWDDLAKDPNLSTPELEHFLPILLACER